MHEGLTQEELQWKQVRAAKLAKLIKLPIPGHFRDLKMQSPSFIWKLWIHLAGWWKV